MLIENTLFGRIDKVAQAITRIKLHKPDDGYYVAFSGGKDSCVILDLVQRAGVKVAGTGMKPIWFISGRKAAI